MNFLHILFLVLGLLPKLSGDETLAGYAPDGVTWQLVELDEVPFPAEATLEFHTGGEVTGTGPCNLFNARQTAPYPWFYLTAFAATRRACPDLGLEARYFGALAAMTLSEVSGLVLILSSDDGRQMVFEAR